MAYQLPKPMFVFVFEGELLPFMYNGDRLLLLALLPRRKPRTDKDVEMQPPYRFKDLNLTTVGYSDSLTPWDRDMDFVSERVSLYISNAYRVCGSSSRPGPGTKKPGPTWWSREVTSSLRSSVFVSRKRGPHRCRSRCSCT